MIVRCGTYFFLVWSRTGESRGFAFVRYKYADEAQKAVERLDGLFYLISVRRSISSLSFSGKAFGFDYCFLLFILGRVVDGREIMVQFAKYGPNAERM